MVILVYFLISLVGGIIPAFLAKQRKKNFILWWIYGTFFLPIALLHAILLLLKAEKGILAVRILLIIYTVVAFYFITWSASTQPEALRWLEIGKTKYALGKSLYENSDKVMGLTSNIVDYFAKETDYDRETLKKAFSGIDNEKLKEKVYLGDFARNKIKEVDEKVKESIWTEKEGKEIKDIYSTLTTKINNITSFTFVTVQDYLEENTDVEREIIDSEFSYFENEKHTDKEYVQSFALELIKTLENVVKETTDKGAFEEWSVPMGEAKKVFLLYLESLKDLNIYLKDNTSALESNYKAYLKTEATYFHKTTIADEYIALLDKEVLKDIDDERRLELIDQYTYIGDRLVEIKQQKASLRCFDSAIALYREIIQHPEIPVKEKAEYLLYIGELYDKKIEIDAAIDVFKEFLSVYFNKGLFLDEDNVYDLEAFLNLNEMKKNKKNLIKGINVFMDFVSNFSSPEKEKVCITENKVLNIFFPKLPKSQRAKYVPVIQKNYNYLISPKTLDVFPIIKEAFDFFDKFHFDDVAQTYIDMLEEVEPIAFSAIDEVKETTSLTLLAEIGKAQEYVENIFISGTLLDAKSSAEIKKLQNEIRNNSKEVIDTIIRIKDVMTLLDDLMTHIKKDKKIKKTLQKNLDDKTILITSVQSDISKTTKGFNDVVKNIFSENKILTEEYDAVLGEISEAQELGESLGLVPPGQRKTKKEDMLNLRTKIKNEVNSLAGIIDNLITAKNEVAKKYNATPPTQQLREIKEKLLSLKEDIDTVVEKYFPGELEKLDAET